MRKGYTYQGKVQGGKFERWSALETLFRNMEGKEIAVAVKESGKVRSNKQNRYFHGVVVPEARLGLQKHGIYLDLDQTKELLRSAGGLYQYITLPQGEPVRIPVSTTDLTAVEFNEFLEKITEWLWQDYRIYITAPNQPTLEALCQDH